VNSTKFPALPPYARLYSIPAGHRFIFVAGGALFLFAFVMVALLPVYQPNKPALGPMAFCLPGFGGFVALSVYGFLACRAKIAITDEGIWSVTPRKPTVFLNWREISRIEEHRFKQRLVLSDSGGLRQIKVEYQLEEFDELRRIILSRATARSPLVGSPTVFHGGNRLYVQIGVTALIFLAFAIFAYHQKAHSGAIFFGAFAVLALATMLNLPLSLRLLDDGLIFVSPLGRRQIRYADIRGLDLRNETVRGNSFAVVLIQTDGKPLRLAGFKEGSIALYEALRNRLQKETVGRSS
jgi:hypothetical protein